MIYSPAPLGVALAALALGLVAISLIKGVRVDLESYLFGEILAVTVQGLVVIRTGAGLVLALLVWPWQALLTSTLLPDLATARSISPQRKQLIIRAATARPFAHTPQAMAELAVAVRRLSALGGLAGALTFDTPACP